ncbi:MAG: thiamine pyrophosphate-dependent enzyme, partial [Propionibacteriaceae bacterium]
GVAWALGITPAEMLAKFRGTTMATSWNSEEKRMNHYTVIIGAQALHATGYAMGLTKDGMVGNPDASQNAAVLSFCGDGAISQGDVNEAFVFANSYQAPVVFLISNNQWAISEPVSLQSRQALYLRAQGFGMPGVQVDGNDVLAVHAVTSWAMERARSGQGPALVECFTYRMGAHTTSDDPSKYRSKDEQDAWAHRDPIDRVKRYLLNQGAIDEAWLAQIEADADDLGEQIRQTCKSLTNPSMDSVFENVYAEKTSLLERQHADYAELEASFAEEAK